MYLVSTGRVSWRLKEVSTWSSANNSNYLFLIKYVGWSMFVGRDN